MKKKLFLLSALAALSGCASTYQVPSDKPSAEVMLRTQSDTSNTFAKTIFLDVFEDSGCQLHEFGKRAGSKMKNEDVTKTGFHPIIAGEPFTFTAGYIDARAAQNRTCSVTGVFEPKQNHKYKVQVEVIDDGLACKLGVFDVSGETEEKVAFTMPEFACVHGGPEYLRNGEPLWYNWTVSDDEY